MNVADVAALVSDGLSAAGIDDVPVVDPGTPVAALPVVVLAPADNELGDGNRYLIYGLDVTVVVPRSNQVDQYLRLCELEAAVVQGLLPSQVRFEGPFVFAVTGGDGTGEPPAMSRVIPISFTGDVNLC